MPMKAPRNPPTLDNPFQIIKSTHGFSVTFSGK